MSNLIFEIEGSYRNRISYLVEIVKYVYKEMPLGYNMYLLVGDVASSPMNRITNYWKLWKGLSRGFSPIVDGEYSPEYSVIDDDGIKFFGAIKIRSISSIPEVVEFLYSGLNTSLLLLPENIDINDFIKYGFKRDIEEDEVYMTAVANVGGIVLIYKELFDDMYTNIIGIGDSDSITKWYNNLTLK